MQTLGKAEARERRSRHGPRPEGSSGYSFLEDTSQLVFVAPVGGRCGLAHIA